jgi:hypothetical protein
VLRFWIMVEEYTMKIEHIFYLKENQDLTTEQRNTLMTIRKDTFWSWDFKVYMKNVKGY